MAKSTRRTVWIDMENSPHVQFFTPLMRELKSRGHRVIITARDFAQTVELLEQLDLEFEQIGEHGGRSTVGKATAVLRRVRPLAEYARRNGADVGVHLASSAQSIAARVAGIPSIALMDYEFQPANHLSFRLADVVLVPDSIPARSLAPLGAGRRLRRYEGLKEDFYVASLMAMPIQPLKIDGLDPDRPLLVLRPPPHFAAYHRFTNPLWEELLHYLASRSEISTLVLPRTKDQADGLHAEAPTGLLIVPQALPPAAILERADGVITGGGTMGREAAALGIPAYSLFAGRRGGVDTQLIAEGRLVEIARADDFDRIVLEKRSAATLGDLERERELVSWLADLVLATASGSSTSA